MDNLSDSGLNLRNIEVRQLNQIVSDINYNFKQMLQLSGFKGLKGEAGDSVIGATGQRGNMWFFADSARFISLYTTVTSSGQVSLPFINGQLNTNLSTLLLALNVTELVQNDIVVLPSRDVIQFSSSTNSFIDTGIRFADGLSLTESEVISIVNNILGGLDNNDVFTTYKGIVKNYADNSTGLNTEQNTNSILDLNVSIAGEGVTSDIFQFTSLKEAVITSTIQNMLITGSPVEYHKLAQATMTNHTVDFMAGVDDFGALTVMQNSYKNGIIIGSTEDADFSTFGRMFRTQDKLRFLSDYHPNLDVVGRLDLSKSGTELYSPKDLKMIIKSGFVAIEDYSTTKKWLYADNNVMTLGYDTLPNVKIENEKYLQLFSQIGATTEILGLYGNEVKASRHQPKSDILTNSDLSLVTHNLLFDFAVSTNNAIQLLDDRLDVLEAQEVYKEQTLHLGNVNLNGVDKFGLHIIKYSPSATYTNFPNAILGSNDIKDSIVKVNTYTQNAFYWVEQVYVVRTTNNALLTSKRSGYSSNTGTAYTWSEWTNLLDSDNFEFKSGGKMNVSPNKFGDNFSTTINHDLHTVNTIKADGINDEDIHKVIIGFDMDNWGHTTTAISKDLDEWYYTKKEIDEMNLGGVPIGTIALWHSTPQTIPIGWALCDGENGTRKMKAGHFPIPYVASAAEFDEIGQVGGNRNITLNINQLPPHHHTSGLEALFNYHGGGSAVTGTNRSWGTGSGFPAYANQNSSTVGNGSPIDIINQYEVFVYMQYIGEDKPNILTNVLNYTGTVGVAFSTQLTSNDTTSIWSVTGLPSGLSLDPQTGIISGTPTQELAATTYTVTATNSNGESDPLVITFTINSNVTNQVVYTGSDTVYIYRGLFFAFFPQFNNLGTNTYTYSYNMPIIPWLSFNNANGEIESNNSFVPQTVPLGTIPSTLILTRDDGVTFSFPIEFIVVDPNVNAPNLTTLRDLVFVRKIGTTFTLSLPTYNTGMVAETWYVNGLIVELVLNGDTIEMTIPTSSLTNNTTTYTNGVSRLVDDTGNGSPTQNLPNTNGNIPVGTLHTLGSHILLVTAQSANGAVDTAQFTLRVENSLNNGTN